jgi:hypothetical protein
MPKLLKPFADSWMLPLSPVSSGEGKGLSISPYGDHTGGTAGVSSFSVEVVIKCKTLPRWFAEHVHWTAAAASRK